MIRAAALAVLLLACGGDAATSALADGTHFGFVTALEPERLRLEFDEAERLDGDDAADAADAADGAVVTEEGSYVRNAEARSVPVDVDPDVVVRLLRPCCELREVAFVDWLAGFEPDERSFYGTSASHYELTVVGGRVVAVDEVYLP